MNFCQLSVGYLGSSFEYRAEILSFEIWINLGTFKICGKFFNTETVEIFYLRDLSCGKSQKINLGEYKAGLSILPQFICLKIDKKFNFK